MGNDPSTKRKKQGDFYETPRWAIEALLKREGFDGVILFRTLLWKGSYK
ncbi:hypothetical protein CLROS_007660 [Clostridium felsineum]|uniref:Uncharacterized protein n=1 Tax=Clostridium felsineum TaxID=36839 RepID=A0A1S8KWV3_9CLOT|nr:hypothetical protein [Clostridium felsineum]URZ05440.1 hypothetical protein CLROS_007660 [Clostridium felsineum]URZ10481.1 hypothetical protein CROST_011910 [Clostridium felsineum]